MAIIKQLAIEATGILQSLEEPERSIVQQFAAIACWSLLEYPNEIAKCFQLDDVQVARLYVLSSVVSDSKLLWLTEQTRVFSDERRQSCTESNDDRLMYRLDIVPSEVQDGVDDFVDECREMPTLVKRAVNIDSEIAEDHLPKETFPFITP